MHVYRYSKNDRLWTVGYYEPSGSWHPIADCNSEQAAMRMVNFLNGGNGNYPVPSFLD